MIGDRKLVKLSGKVVEVSTTAKGVKARALSDDELFEANVLESDFEKMFQNDFNELTNAAYAELKQSLKTSLKKAALASLGFEHDSYHGEWSVDHCNGRMSVITEHLTAQVKDLFRERVNQLIVADQDAIVKEARTAIQKEFKEVFLREVRDKTRSKAREAAENFLDALMQEKVKGFEKQAVACVQARLLGKPIPTTDEPEVLDGEIVENKP